VHANGKVLILFSVRLQGRTTSRRPSGSPVRVRVSLRDSSRKVIRLGLLCLGLVRALSGHQDQVRVTLFLIDGGPSTRWAALSTSRLS
jgi:hypothetical protein